METEVNVKTYKDLVSTIRNFRPRCSSENISTIRNFWPTICAVNPYTTATPRRTRHIHTIPEHSSQTKKAQWTPFQQSFLCLVYVPFLAVPIYGIRKLSAIL